MPTKLPIGAETDYKSSTGIVGVAVVEFDTGPGDGRSSNGLRR